MKKTLALLLALLLLTGCGANTPKEEPVVEEPIAGETVEEPAEESSEPAYLGDFSAQTLTGETLDQSFFANADLTVINIWATYCAPCKEEMPILAKLHNELDGVQIVGLILDCTDETDNVIESQAILAKALMEDAGVTYENMLLNQDLMDCGFGAVSAVPATIFVDRDGNTVGQGFYGALDENGWREAIAERLEIAQARYE